MNYQSLIETLLVTDAILLKASGASIDALFMNLELKLHRELGRTFQARARRAINSIKPSDSNKTIASKLAAPFDGWDDDVDSVVTAVTRQAYIEGKRSILLRAHGKLADLKATSGQFPRLVRKAPREISIEPSFELVDRNAIEHLVGNQLHWIGDNYDNNLAEEIDNVIRSTMVESGLGRVEAAKLLRTALEQRFALSVGDMPEGWQSRMESYFELISANAVGNARVRGAIQAMTEISVDRYQIVAAGDERTCSRCMFMDGQTFTVATAKRHIDKIMDADTPDDVRAAHPWADNVEEMQSNPARFPFPPFHGICRCTVDIAHDAEISFDGPAID